MEELSQPPTVPEQCPDSRISIWQLTSHTMQQLFPINKQAKGFMLPLTPQFTATLLPATVCLFQCAAGLKLTASRRQTAELRRV